eukprot:1033886-Alexandrium_andersonii.AAC.1
MQLPPAWHKRKRPLCDVKALARPEVAKAIARDLEALPTIPCSVDPDTHVAMLNQAVVQVAKKHAPLVRHPKKDWITESTWNLMAQAATQRDIIRRHCRALQRD